MTEKSLQKLIEELCPDGVEYKKISAIAEVSIGEFVHKSMQSDDSPYPVYNGGITNTGYYDSYNRTENKIIISARGANAGFVNRVFTKYWSGNSCYTIDVTDESVNWTYVYYCLKNNEKALLGSQQKAGIPAVSKAQVEEFEIPVLPLPVQEEIVRILDKFTELEQELEQELELRKKQYEYYRDKILSLSDYDGEVESCTLGDIAFYPKDRIDASDLDENNYVGVDNMLQQKLGITVSEAVPTTGRWSKYLPNDVLIGNIRPYLRKIWLADREGGTNGDVVVLRSKDEAQIYPRFLYHICASERFFEYDNGKSKGAKMPRGDKGMIPLFEVVVPKDINEQIRIANVLDKFDKLTSDISEGLPAEIKMRHQQYEYYRDKLLNFKRLEVA